MKQYFADFIDDLKATHGKNLASVLLYGPAATGEFDRRRQDHNLLIALHKIRPEDLRNAHATMREWQRTGNPVPVYFTVSELQNAGDVFPMEFSQMEAARKVLYGTDVLAGLEFSDKNLRHETEFELRSSLIKLRRQYISASTSVDRLKKLMADSLSSFAAIFRAVLILHGEQPDSRAIVALTAQHLKIDGAPFEKIFNIRENNFAAELDEKSANNLFGEYMEQIEKVIHAVDSIEK
jgi:hypothetical protein